MPGGEISVAESGGFGAVTVTQAVSIVGDGQEAGIAAGPGVTSITINAGPNDVVVLRGLVIDGAAYSGSGQHGIQFNSGRALHIQNCVIKNFTSLNSRGIYFAPATAAGTPAELFVSDTIITNTGNPSTGSGAAMSIEPTGAGGANVTLTRVRMENNFKGLSVRGDGLASPGTINAVMFNSTSAGNSGEGVIATTTGTGGTVNVTVAGSTVAQNATGLSTVGANAMIRVGNTAVTGNVNAVVMDTANTVLSYKTNRVDGNVTNGTPITQTPLN